MLLDRQDGKLDAVDAREREQVSTEQAFGAPGEGVGERNVDRELLKATPRELRLDAVAHRREVAVRFQARRPLDVKNEEVAEIQCLRGEEVLDGCVFIVATAEVDVLRRARAAAHAEVERHRPLQHPASGRDRHEASKKAVERDRLAKTHKWGACGDSVVFEPLVEGGAKRAGCGVPQDVVASERSMSRVTRLFAPAPRRRSWAGVVMPAVRA